MLSARDTAQLAATAAEPAQKNSKSNKETRAKDEFESYASRDVRLRNPALHGGERRKIRVRLRLIPVANRIVIVDPIVIMPMLGSVLHVTFERHRIVSVPAVQAVASA